MDSSGSINLSSTKSGDAAAPFTSPSHLSVSRSQVKRQLERLNRNKAAGPDGVSPRVLKACAEQLCGILQHLFNLSLAQEKVPVLWKTSCLVPVPKKTRPSVNDDYRPVALTSHIMKVLERLLLVHLNKQTRTYQDPLQFAYRHGVGVEDAIIQLLQPTHCHLDKAGSTVRVMFFDFSSAFNTIQPDVLCQKLQKTQVGASTIAWIKDYLTNRPQFVRLKNCTSNQAISNIGAPQGTVLSPFLFTLYTSDFQYKSETCHLQKYSDDSAVVGCIRDGQEAEYRELVERFVAWCGNNHLTLNVNKTKEMILDFRRNRVESNTVSIMGEEVEVVEEYKYLGVHLDNRLDWRKNSEAVYKKGHSRLHFLRTLRSFNVCSKMLQIFYKSVVESVISSAIVCWGSSIRSRDLKRLNSLIKKAGSVLGTTVEPLEEIMQRRILQRIKKIMDNPEHSLHKTVRQRKSVFSQRLLQFRCNTDRYWRSFLPTAIVIYNNSMMT
uniref:Reverse transcriptase domain-containing protein n=2 Tax=Nothobranchius furzeri TaxID=105023 RepID=A0A8C6LZA4_NOTFU